MKFDTKKSLYILLFLVIGITSCREGNSIYDPEYEPQPDPVITSISPEEGYLAGVDSITIHGENFADDIDANTVSFNGEAGIILSATPTQLGVRPAQVEGDDIEVMVSTRGAVNFSNKVIYRLDGAIENIPGYNQAHNTTGITRNMDGDIIFTLLNDAGGTEGIKVWRSNDTVEDYVSVPASANYLAIKMGPDGLLYGVRNNHGIYREDEGEMSAITGRVQGESFRNLDFGEDDYLWVVGSNIDNGNHNILRVDISSGAIELFPFTANLRGVRYYENQLYVGGTFTDSEGGTTEQVWVLDVTANNNLENAQRIFTVEEVSAESMEILDITFDIEGRMYLGTTAGSGIYTWDEEGFNEMYSGLIRASGAALTWVDNYLVASINNLGESTRHPTKIDVRRQGAPYFGTIE